MEAGNRLAAKVAIVSGAASGIGAETARVFAAQGAKVVACDVNEADGNAVVEAPACRHSFQRPGSFVTSSRIT
jgi:NAD(P)-dependent dehydrogenase (short-subunit alcohol dehydrogenase family)